MKSLFAFALASLVSTAALAKQHVQATNCEIFVDKITAFSGSHALRAAAVYVKIMPTRLDGKVVEVGFRDQVTDLSSGRVEGWTNEHMYRFADAWDYFRLDRSLSHDWGIFSYEGAFYVKTDKDTYYWAKSAGGNFVFDRSTYNNVMYLAGKSTNYSSGPESGVPSQNHGMEYFNPGRCY